MMRSSKPATIPKKRVAGPKPNVLENCERGRVVSLRQPLLLLQIQFQRRQPSILLPAVIFATGGLGVHEH